MTITWAKVRKCRWREALDAVCVWEADQQDLLTLDQMWGVKEGLYLEFSARAAIDTGLVQMGDEQTMKAQQEPCTNHTECEMRHRHPRGKSRGHRLQESGAQGRCLGWRENCSILGARCSYGIESRRGESVESGPEHRVRGLAASLAQP